MCGFLKKSYWIGRANAKNVKLTGKETRNEIIKKVTRVPWERKLHLTKKRVTFRGIQMTEDKMKKILKYNRTHLVPMTVAKMRERM